MGFLGTKAFLCPPFLDYRKQSSFSLYDLPWVPASGFKQLLIREGRGCRDKGGTVKKKKKKNTIVQPWGRGLVSPQGIHITISLSCFADTETSTRWEKLTACCPQAHRPQTGWNRKVDDADDRLPHHQPIRRMSRSWSRPLWTMTIKLLTTYHLQVGTHSFEGISLLWPLLPGKAIKLFFSTSPQTLSPRFNSVSGYRGHIRLQRHPFRLYGSEGISGTEDKRPNIMTEDAPIALIAQEIPRVWGSCKPGIVN